MKVKGLDSGLFDTGFGTALFAVTHMIIFVILIGWTARSQSQSDEKRRWAEKELERLAQTLEERVTERTGQLEASRMHTERILTTALDAFIGMDAAGVITDWNVQAEQMFGWPRQEAIGRLLSATVIPAQHREAHERGLRHFLATGEGPVLNTRIEVMACHRDGHEFPAELAISPAVQWEGTFTFSAFVRDITEQKRSKARSVVQHGTAQVLAESHTLLDAMPKILHAICDLSHWDLGALWFVNENIQPTVLNCAEIWHQSSAKETEFSRVTRQTVFTQGLGLPGRVWASGEPTWVPDVMQDTNFPRAQFAAQANLHGAFAFP